MNDLTTTQPRSLGFVEAAVQTFEGIQRLAEVMAKCGTLPAHIQGKPQDCFRIVVQAAKWKMDPFAVAECTSLVHGKMCYEGKLVAAVLQSMAAIDGRLEYVITGKGQNAEIDITGTPRGGKPQTLHGTVRDWRTNGSNSPWDKQPEDQLIYRGTRQWARRYAPEAVLGVYTPDELEDDAIDVTATSTVRPAVAEPARVAAPVDAAPPVSVDEPKKAAAATTKPTAHPAIDTARELYRNLGGHGKDIIARVCKLHGANDPKGIAADKLEAFGADIAQLAATHGELPKIEDLLGGWELSAREEGSPS